MRRLLATFVFAMLLLGSPCVTAQSPTMSPSASATPDIDFLADDGELLTGYLATDESSAIFLQWTATTDTVSGTMTRAFIDGDGGTELRHDTTPFSGLLGGQQLTIDLDLGLGASTRWTGLFRGDTLVLSLPGSEGSIETINLVRATVNDYNRTVGALLDQVVAAQERAALAADLAARRQQVDLASRAVVEDMARIDATISDLATALAELATDSRELRRDGQAVRAATVDLLEQARTHPRGDGSEVCWQADGVSFDADTVDFDVDTVAATADSVRQAIDAVDQAASTLQRDDATLRAAVVAVPEGVVGDLPSSDEVATALQRVRDAHAAAEADLARRMDAADDWAAKVLEYVATADAACQSYG